MDCISFECGNCGATLKVRAGFAGRSVQCPKCAKKTLVPAPGVESAPAAPAPAVRQSAPAPAPEPPGPEPVPAAKPTEPQVSAAAPAPQSAAAADTSTFTARIEQLEKDLAAATERAGAAEKSLQEELAAAKQRAEEAEQKAAAAATAASEAKTAAGLDAEALQEETRVRFEAELRAARATITELQGKLSAAYQERVLGAEPVAAPSPAAADDADIVDADALLADMSALKFGKYLRAAILLHAAVVLVTSIGYFIRLARPEPPPEEEAPAEAPAESTAVPGVVESEPVPAPEPSTERPKTELEKQVESLPVPGEKPPSSAVTLEDDL
jgi:DNA-directed RNA polymerase subunit RPC12/RpoP